MVIGAGVVARRFARPPQTATSDTFHPYWLLSWRYHQRQPKGV